MSTETGYSLTTAQVTREGNTVRPSEARSTPQIPLPAVSASAKQSLKCPDCQYTYKPGELVCSQCGFMFSSRGQSHKPDAGSSNNVELLIAQSSEADTRPIYFEIDGQQFLLPAAPIFTVGRFSPVVGDIRPDVGLNQFNAESKGVSRQHLRIMRKRRMVYIADLESSNGTFLNGRRLTRNCYRMLTPGDELELGLLKITVLF